MAGVWRGAGGKPPGAKRPEGWAGKGRRRATKRGECFGRGVFGGENSRGVHHPEPPGRLTPPGGRAAGAKFFRGTPRPRPGAYRRIASARQLNHPLGRPGRSFSAIRQLSFYNSKSNSGVASPGAVAG